MKPVDLTVIAQSFERRSAAQHLVDRFLIGYPREGRWVDPAGRRVILSAPEEAATDDLRQRRVDFQLETTRDAQGAATAAATILLVPADGVSVERDRFVRETLEVTRTGARVFVHGPLASDRSTAEEFTRLADFRSVKLGAGSYFSSTLRLPAVDVPRDAELREAVIVTTGAPGWAEFRALDALLPLLERRRGGEAGVESVRALAGDAVWRAQSDREWSRELVGAAISRSSTPHGASQTESRPQNLLGLGEVRRLAKDPLAYVIDHVDGVRSTVLVLNGVIGELNVAVKTSSGELVSTQFFEQPSKEADEWDGRTIPMEHQWSSLAANLDDSLQTDQVDWLPGPRARALATATLLGLMKEARSQLAFAVKGPGEVMAYTNHRPSLFERS